MSKYDLVTRKIKPSEFYSKELIEKVNDTSGKGFCHKEDPLYQEGFHYAVNWCRAIIKEFTKEWNKESTKRIPYVAMDELDEHIMQREFDK